MKHMWQTQENSDENKKFNRNQYYGTVFRLKTYKNVKNTDPESVSQSLGMFDSDKSELSSIFYSTNGTSFKNQQLKDLDYLDVFFLIKGSRFKKIIFNKWLLKMFFCLPDLF